MIGYAMLYAVAVGLPTLLAALLGSRVLRDQGKAERAVWLAALALAMTLPLVALSSPGTEGGTAPAPPAESGFTGLPAVVAVPAVPTVTLPVAPATALGLDELVIGLWLSVSLILAIRWLVAAYKLRSLTRTCPATMVDGVQVTLTSELGPAVAGVLGPRILAPRWLMSLPEGQRRLVLAHEEEHIRAGDPWLFALSRVARILVPWNPFVWLLSARLLRAVELDCDRRVLRRHPDVRAYGLTLLTVSSRDPIGLLGAAAFAESEAPLRQRILTMTAQPGTVSIVSVLSALVLGVILILGVFEVPVPIARTDPGPVAAAGWDPAEGGAIAGVVRDAVTDQPMEHVQIWLPAMSLGVLSNGDGRIMLEGVPAGEHQVVAERIGHGRAEKTVTVTEGETAAVDFQLQEIAIPVPGIIVTGGGHARLSREPASPSPSPSVQSGIPGRPVFTPYSVAPNLVNVGEVGRALMEGYPAELRQAGVGGTVDVYLFLDADGEVEDFRVNESSGQRALDDAALAAAGVYRFSPALNRDARHPVWVAFSVTFVAEE